LEPRVVNENIGNMPVSVLQRRKQKISGRKVGFEVFLDLLEMVTALGLALFVWMHSIFVSTIHFNHGATFDTLSKFFDKYYLAPVGIPIVFLLFYVHAITAGRKIPNKYSEARVAWHHARMINHTETWIWIFQVITGIALFAFVSIHLWVIASDFYARFLATGVGLSASISAARVQGAVFAAGIKGIGPSFFWFYIILSALAQYHVGFGLYRVFVKWGWFKRQPLAYVIIAITLIMLTISGFTITTLKTLNI